MDTWLEQKDIERLFKITSGELSESFTTQEELLEFERLINVAVANKKKMGYTKHVVFH
jgi:hypothetical protein